ncbi:MAG: hypothetical protein WC197_07410 [Candidatus Gastranaerophilaceae bacterium]|jgi:hypothetical protein
MIGKISFEYTNTQPLPIKTQENKRELSLYTVKNQELAGFSGIDALKASVLCTISFKGCGGGYLSQNIQAKADDTKLWSFSVRQDEKPTIGRIVVKGNWSGKPELAKKLLEETCNNWPKGQKVEFLIGCGGLAQFDWPKNIPVGKEYKNSMQDKQNGIKYFEELTQNAEKVVKAQILTPEVVKKLSKITDFISFGIDSASNKNGELNEPHAELVCFVDLENNKYHWTGKSYPWAPQIKGLIKAPLESHFIDNINGKNITILGCNDLVVFHPRSKSEASIPWRVDLLSGIRKLTSKHKPDIVLQHPHTTDTHNTWYLAWKELVKDFPTVKAYASSGKYYNDEGHERASLEKVLENTKEGNSVDMILSLN